MLTDAIDLACEKLKDALYGLVESAYMLGGHDAARTIAGLVLGQMDEPTKEDVIEMCRRLWEENDK